MSQELFNSLVLWLVSSIALPVLGVVAIIAWFWFFDHLLNLIKVKWLFMQWVLDCARKRRNAT